MPTSTPGVTFRRATKRPSSPLEPTGCAATPAAPRSRHRFDLPPSQPVPRTPVGMETRVCGVLHRANFSPSHRIFIVNRFSTRWAADGRPDSGLRRAKAGGIRRLGVACGGGDIVFKNQLGRGLRLAERMHAVLTLSLFMYQFGAMALFFASGAHHPLWQPSQVLVGALLGGVVLAIGLHFLLAGIVSRSMGEPFAVSMYRGIAARALRAHAQVDESAVYPGYLLGSTGPMARTYVSAGHGRGLLFTRATSNPLGGKFIHMWVETCDIDRFLRALREAVGLSLRGRPASTRPALSS